MKRILCEVCAIALSLTFAACNTNTATIGDSKFMAQTAAATTTTTEAVATTTPKSTTAATTTTTAAVTTTTPKPTTAAVTTTRPVQTTKEQTTAAKWTETAYNATMYTTTACYSRAEAVIGADAVKAYAANTAIKVTAKCNTGYYKLDTDSYIHGDYLSKTKQTVQTTAAVTTSTPKSTTAAVTTSTPKSTTAATTTAEKTFSYMTYEERKALSWWKITEADIKEIRSQVRAYVLEQGYTWYDDYENHNYMNSSWGYVNVNDFNDEGIHHWSTEVYESFVESEVAGYKEMIDDDASVGMTRFSFSYDTGNNFMNWEATVYMEDWYICGFDSLEEQEEYYGHWREKGVYCMFLISC